MEIMKYLTSHKTLEEKEKFLLSLIDTLEEESNKLYDEVVDLDCKSFYKYDNLYERYLVLSELYEKVSEGYNFLYEIEKNSIGGVKARLRLKWCLATIMSFYASLASPTLGLYSGLILLIKAFNDFNNERDYVMDRGKSFYTDRIPKINLILENSSRFLTKKNDKMNDIFKEFNIDPDNVDLDLMVSNYIISSYIEGEMDEETIESYDENIKKYVINLLKSDLNVDSDNIYELLEMTKENNQKSLHLEKMLN